MPINIDIFDFSCKNQLRNGENFDKKLGETTPNLVGNVGEKVEVLFRCVITQSAFTEGSEEWLIFNDLNEIRRSSGSFLDDRIQVGDVYNFFSDWNNRKSGTAEYSGTVDFISSDGRTLRYSVNSGNDTTNGEVSNVGMSFDQLEPENLNTALFLKFGLIGNDETFNFISKVSESQQAYYIGGMSPSGVGISPQIFPMTSLGGIKDWVTGSARTGVAVQSFDFEDALYLVEHRFTINPFYILAYREFILNGTIPDLLAGDSSIKYAAEVELRKTLSNTGSSKQEIFDNLNGFVGWYGENFNGLNAKYAVQSVTYEDVNSGDVLAAININLNTRVTIVLEEIGGNITDYSCGVYLFKVPESENDYQGTTTDMLTNFLFKSTIVSNPDTDNGDVTTSLVGGNLVIQYDISFSIAEKLQLSTDDEYILLVQIEDPKLSAGNSDRIMLLADFKNYVDIDFLVDFIRVESYNFLTHDKVLGSGSSTTIVANEDGILLNAIIGANTTRNVIINEITLNLIAFNESENKSFNLDTFVFNVGEPVLSSNLQQIQIDNTRGYPLPEGDKFNFANISTLGLSGDNQQFSVQLGQKIRWQDWLFNPNVDDVFFDASQINNNLNFKSSNYSNQQGYVIKLAASINVSGFDDLNRQITGDFVFVGGDIQVRDYEETEDVTGIIETFDLDSGQSLGGGVLFNGKDTLFKCTFQNAELISFGIHRIEPSQNQGDGILELSSVLPSVGNNLLKPLDGENLLKFTLTGSTLVTECLIDGSLIQEGVSYKLSARVGNKF